MQLEEGSNVENLQAQRCRARIDHLDSADVENITEWNNTKLKRILVDYMLRMSYFETASKLSESSNISVSLFLLWHWLYNLINCSSLELYISMTWQYETSHVFRTLSTLTYFEKLRRWLTPLNVGRLLLHWHGVLIIKHGWRNQRCVLLFLCLLSWLRFYFLVFMNSTWFLGFV